MAVDDGWEQVTTGKSGAVVRRSPDGKSYSKAISGSGLGEVRDEHERLVWLAETGLPAPRVLDWQDDGNTATLTTSTVPGVPLSDLSSSDVPDAMTALGAFLRELHAVERTSCPFERWLAVSVPLARVRVAEGLVDASDFDQERLGLTPAGALQHVLDGRPRAEKLEQEALVVCHGDACLPNFLIDPETMEITGMIDVGSLGVADRHLDIALATRSIADTSLNPAYGPEAADMLLAAYAWPIDDVRIEFYRLLDEFF